MTMSHADNQQFAQTEGKEDFLDYTQQANTSALFTAVHTVYPTTSHCEKYLIVFSSYALF